MRTKKGARVEGSVCQVDSNHMVLRAGMKEAREVVYQHRFAGGWGGSEECGVTERVKQSKLT